jgi:hypothetical protein
VRKGERRELTILSANSRNFFAIGEQTELCERGPMAFRLLLSIAVNNASAKSDRAKALPGIRMSKAEKCLRVKKDTDGRLH